MEAGQPVGQCILNQLDGAVEIQLLHQLGLVKLNGAMRNRQLVRDVFGGESVDDKLENFLLAEWSSVF